MPTTNSHVSACKKFEKLTVCWLQCTWHFKSPKHFPRSILKHSWASVSAGVFPSFRQFLDLPLLAATTFSPSTSLLISQSKKQWQLTANKSNRASNLWLYFVFNPDNKRKIILNGTLTKRRKKFWSVYWNVAAKNTFLYSLMFCFQSFCSSSCSSNDIRSVSRLWPAILACVHTTSKLITLQFNSWLRYSLSQKKRWQLTRAGQNGYCRNLTQMRSPTVNELLTLSNAGSSSSSNINCAVSVQVLVQGTGPLSPDTPGIDEPWSSESAMSVLAFNARRRRPFVVEVPAAVLSCMWKAFAFSTLLSASLIDVCWRQRFTWGDEVDKTRDLRARAFVFFCPWSLCIRHIIYLISPSSINRKTNNPPIMPKQ